MATSTVRISGHAHRALRELAEKTGQPMQAILDKAIEEYWRRAFLEEANAAYAALRAHPDAWNEELAERGAWDATLADGLGDD